VKRSSGPTTYDLRRTYDLRLRLYKIRRTVKPSRYCPVVYCRTERDVRPSGHSPLSLVMVQTVWTCILQISRFAFFATDSMYVHARRQGCDIFPRRMCRRKTTHPNLCFSKTSHLKIQYQSTVPRVPRFGSSSSSSHNTIRLPTCSSRLTSQVVIHTTHPVLSFASYRSCHLPP
jgi:hypothetical protein